MLPPFLSVLDDPTLVTAPDGTLLNGFIATTMKACHRPRR